MSTSSTTISSPSTPATELPHSTYTSTSSPPQSSSTAASTSTSRSSSNAAATLADLPPDFQFPAIVHDEYGNEMRVDLEDMADDDFLKRVSHLPIVRGTLKAYELGKQRSRMVRYGGDFVESSVKAISRPVVSRLGARLGERGVEQLDDFACRQLDRVSENEQIQLEFPNLNNSHCRFILLPIDRDQRKRDNSSWQNWTKRNVRIGRT